MDQKIHLFFTRLFSGQVSSVISTLIWLTAGHSLQAIVLAGWGQAAPFSVIAFQPLMLGASLNSWACSLLHGNTRARNQLFASKKALGRSQSAAVWEYWRSLAQGNNVYLMVSTICIDINSNEYFSHILCPHHSLCHCDREIWRGKKHLLPTSAHRQAWNLCKMQHLFLLSYSKSHSVADFQSAGDGREKAWKQCGLWWNKITWDNLPSPLSVTKRPRLL